MSPYSTDKELLSAVVVELLLLIIAVGVIFTFTTTSTLSDWLGVPSLVNILEVLFGVSEVALSI
jgi:hypothetical protein